MDHPVIGHIGYGVVSATSLIMLAAERVPATIDPTGLLTIVPQWVIITGWILGTIAVTADKGASAYKKAMEGRAALINECTAEKCPYRQHFRKTHPERISSQ